MLQRSRRQAPRRPEEDEEGHSKPEREGVECVEEGFVGRHVRVVAGGGGGGAEISFGFRFSEGDMEASALLSELMSAHPPKYSTNLNAQRI